MRHCHVTALHFFFPGCIHICKYPESTILKITTCSSSSSVCSGNKTESFSITENML